MLKGCVTRTCLGHQIAPFPSKPVKLQQFLSASHGLCAWPLSLFWGTGGHSTPLTWGPTDEVLLSAPPLLLPVLGVMPCIHSELACSHSPDGNDFQMEQGNFELVTQRVEYFLAHCLPSGPNICELALFRIRLQALKNTHTALSGGLAFSHFSQPSKPSTIMSHSNCSPDHSLRYVNTPRVKFWMSACYLVSQAPLQFLSCFLFMSWGKSSQNLFSVPHVLETVHCKS